jgi:hypothetical protein
MLDRIDLPDLDGFPQPYWNNAQSVSAAFHSILNAKDEKSSIAAYHQLLYALGNNHAGTYCPVALAVLPVMERIVRDGEPWAQRSILEVLFDLSGSFQPEPAYEQYHGESLAHLVQQRIACMEPLFGPIAKNGGIAAKSAMELIKELRESSG